MKWKISTLLLLLGILTARELRIEREHKQTATGVAEAAHVEECKQRVDFFVYGGGLDPDDAGAALHACVTCPKDSKEKSCIYWLSRLE